MWEDPGRLDSQALCLKYPFAGAVTQFAGCGDYQGVLTNSLVQRGVFQVCAWSDICKSGVLLSGFAVLGCQLCIVPDLLGC